MNYHKVYEYREIYCELEIALKGADQAMKYQFIKQNQSW